MGALRTQVRLPADVADWLKAQAKLQSRSMNGQLVEYLRQIKREEECRQK